MRPTTDRWWRLRRIVVPSARALGVGWRTTLVLLGVGTGALAATVPVGSLAGGPNGVWGGRLLLGLIRPTALGVRGSRWAFDASVLQQWAAGRLFTLLEVAAAATLFVAGLTILTVSSARAAGRAREVGVRRAVGASRRVLLASVLIEGAVIAGAAVAAGAVVGGVFGHAASATWPGALAPGRTTPIAVIGALVAATLTGGALFPLVFARRTDRIAEVDDRPVGLILVAVQLGVSLAVLVGGGLLAQHANQLAAIGRHGVGDGAVIEVSLPNTETRAVRAHQYARLLHWLEASPATRDSVSLESPGTLVGLGHVDAVTTDCGACPVPDMGYMRFHSAFVTHELISADTFQLLGLPIVAGRGITNADRWGSRPVAVVSQRLAHDHFEPSGAVGRRIKIGYAPGTWYTVVGVVADRQPTGFGGAMAPKYAVYLSVLQHPSPNVDLLVRPAARAPADSLLASLLALETGPKRPRLNRTSEASLLGAEAAPIRWFGRWFSLEGWVVLSLALAGVFAMMRLWVHAMRPDLAVRRAVGARRRHVVTFVLVRAVAVGVGGSLFGAWLGGMLWGLLGSAVAGLPGWDAGLVVRYAVLLVAAAVLGAVPAAWVTARKPPARLIAET